MSFPPGAIWHPSVDADSGEVCVQKMWGPTKQLKDIAVLLRDLLENPSLESPVNVDAAKQLAEDAKAYVADAQKKAAALPAA